MANDLILVELDGIQYCLFCNCVFFDLNFDSALGSALWSVCSMALGMLILRPGKHFIDRSLEVLLLE